MTKENDSSPITREEYENLIALLAGMERIGMLPRDVDWDSIYAKLCFNSLMAE